MKKSVCTACTIETSPGWITNPFHVYPSAFVTGSIVCRAVGRYFPALVPALSTSGDVPLRPRFLSMRVLKDQRKAWIPRPDHVSAIDPSGTVRRDVFARRGRRLKVSRRPLVQFRRPFSFRRAPDGEAKPSQRLWSVTVRANRL